MIQYRATSGGLMFIRLPDNKNIPVAVGNADYQAMQAQLNALPPTAEVLPYVAPGPDAAVNKEAMDRMRALSLLEEADPSGKTAEALRLLGIL